MKESKRIPLILMVLSAALTLLSCLARILLTSSSLDTDYGVYAHGTVMPSVYHAALFILCALIGILAFFKAPKRDADYITPVNDASVFFSCFCAFTLAANAIIVLYQSVLSLTPSPFDILEIAFSVPAILFFFGLVKKNAKPIPMTFASFFPVAWSAVCLIRVYFDNSLLHTSPLKTVRELALLAAMVYFLTESRMLLGIFSHRFYLAAALIAPVFLLTDAVPCIIMSSSLLTADSDSLLRSAVEAVFALFIYARLVSYLTAKPISAEGAPESHEADAGQI